MIKLYIIYVLAKFPVFFHEKVKSNKERQFFSPHKKVTWHTHKYFCSKMAVSIAITKPVCSPKNGAKLAILHTIYLQSMNKDFDGKYLYLYGICHIELAQGTSAYKTNQSRQAGHLTTEFVCDRMFDCYILTVIRMFSTLGKMFQW